jgi:hypothetical protein
MSMQNDDDVLEPEHQQLPPDVQALLRQGRKAQRDLEVEKANREHMELEVAIERAGIPAHPAREIVFKDYNGPFETDAIKAHAEKFGIVVTPPVQDQGPTAEELAAQRQILNAGGGAPAPSGDVDLAVALRNAKSQNEVLAIVAQMAGNPGFRSQDGMIGVLPEMN